MNILGLKKKGSNSSHDIYYCSHCLERVGKEDRDGKLYIDRRKGVGICFRCGFIFIDENYAFINTFLEEEKELKNNNSLLDLSFFKPVNEDSPQYNYLINRGLSEDLIIRYDFRKYKMWGNDCIVIPNKELGINKTDYFQIRFLSGEMRYYNLKSKDKPLTGIRGLLGRPKLMLCEGFFTAVGAMRLPEIDAVAMLGKRLLEHQIEQLVILKDKYDEVIVSLDEDTTLNEKEFLCKQLLKLGINTSCLFPPNNNNKSGVDDLSIDELKSIYNKRININNDTFELIRLGFINIEGI